MRVVFGTAIFAALSCFSVWATPIGLSATVRSEAATTASETGWTTNVSTIQGGSAVAQSQGTLHWTNTTTNKLELMATANAQARSYTDVGVNKVYARATEVTAIAPESMLGYSGWGSGRSAIGFAQSFSYWDDWYQIDSSAQAPVTVTARGYVELASEYWSVGNRTVPWEIYFSAGDGRVQTQQVIKNSGLVVDNGVSTAPKTFTWEWTRNLMPGEWFNFNTSLRVVVGTGNSTFNDMGDKFPHQLMATIDGSHTAVMTGFDVGNNKIVNAANNLVYVNGQYTYQASIDAGLQPDDVNSVSAPSALPVLGSGLLLIALAMLRRRAR